MINFFPGWAGHLGLPTLLPRAGAPDLNVLCKFAQVVERWGDLSWEL